MGESETEVGSTPSDAGVLGRRARSRAAGATPGFVRQVRRFLHDSDVSLQGRRVLALCSGGSDSVVAVDVLARLPRGARPREVVVLFLDHGLRDVAVDRAAAHGVAALHGMALVEGAAGVALSAAAGSAQVPAREWRYAQASAVAGARGCSAVVTGHTADDQLETVLYGLVADGGLRSLIGMPLTSGLAPGVELVRPLLGASRADVLDHARTHGLVWAEDPTNVDEAYRRNHLRHSVVPGLLATHPGAGRNIERARRQLADEAVASSDLATALLGLVADAAAGTLDIRVLDALGPGARRVLLAAWLRAQGVGRGLTARTVEAVAHLVHPGAETGTVHVRGACVRRDGYLLTFRCPPEIGFEAPKTPRSTT